MKPNIARIIATRKSGRTKQSPDDTKTGSLSMQTALPAGIVSHGRAGGAKLRTKHAREKKRKTL